jgi:two-component system KDP operon response regulator KdpE
MSEAKHKVLVVEDNREHMMALVIKLKALGYDVVSASDGATATMVAQREKPDAVLLDLGLPAGDGFVVLKRLKASMTTVSTPVIIVTARPPAGNRAFSLEHGAIAFLQKPVRTEELATALHRGLRLRRELLPA